NGPGIGLEAMGVVVQRAELTVLVQEAEDDVQPLAEINRTRFERAVDDRLVQHSHDHHRDAIVRSPAVLHALFPLRQHAGLQRFLGFAGEPQKAGGQLRTVPARYHMLFICIAVHQRQCRAFVRRVFHGLLDRLDKDHGAPTVRQPLSHPVVVKLHHVRGERAPVLTGPMPVTCPRADRPDWPDRVASRPLSANARPDFRHWSLSGQERSVATRVTSLHSRHCRALRCGGPGISRASARYSSHAYCTVAVLYFFTSVWNAGSARSGAYSGLMARSLQPTGRAGQKASSSCNNAACSPSAAYIPSRLPATSELDWC